MIRRIFIVICAVAAIFTLVGIILLSLGIRPYILLSESMEPELTKGSLVLIQTRTEPESISVGTVVAYRSGTGNKVLHRVVSISTSDDGQIEASLRGDANNVSQTITFDRASLVGSYIFSIPWVGSMIQTLLNHRSIAWVIIIALVLFACLPKLPKAMYPKPTTGDSL